MIFNFVLGIQEIDGEKVKVNRREAVRAIIIHNDKILMVHNNKGDYKFPGGGANKNEVHEETLKREVREETGYIVNNVKDKLGVVIERRPDEFEGDSVFEMTSHYYLCELSGDKTIQQLDDYESELDFHPVWLSLDEGIRLNEEVLEKNKDINPWVYRETTVLRELKEYYSCLK